MNQLKKFESGESIYEKAFREKLNAIVDAVNSLSGANGTDADPTRKVTRAYKGIPVRITDYGSAAGFYEFEEVAYASGDGVWAVVSGGLTHTDLGEARCVGGWLDMFVNYPILGRIVYLRPGLALDSSGGRLFEFSPPAPILFPILMTQTGGSAGSNSAACSFTYTVTDVDSNSLGTSVNPSSSPHTHKRPNLGTMAAATAGLAYYGNNANDPELRIVWCNEVISVSECA